MEPTQAEINTALRLLMRRREADKVRYQRIKDVKKEQNKRRYAIVKAAREAAKAAPAVAAEPEEVS